MKSIYKVVVIIIIAFTVNYHSQSQIPLVFGEIDPCYPNDPTCTFIGPMLMPIYFEDCPDCQVLVEFYYRECAGGFELQLIALYYGKPTGTQTYESCAYCTDIYSITTMRKAFRKVFEQMTKLRGVQGNNYDFFLSQMSCTQYIGPPMESFNDPGYTVPLYEITIPEGSIVNPFEYPEWSTPGDKTVEVYAYRRVCNSDCCCFIVDAMWDDFNVLTGIWVWEPCLPITVYHCPAGCTGGCNDLRFQWIKGAGYINLKTIEDSIHQLQNAQVLVNPNPTTGEINFRVESENNGILNITITDILGNVVLSSDYEKSTLIYEENFRLDSYSGEYFMNFKIGDIFMGSIKVVLVR